MVFLAGNDGRRLEGRIEVEFVLEGDIDDVAFEDGSDFHPPFFATGKGGALGDGPKPEGAPVVHHELEAAVGRGEVVVAVKEVLHAQGLLLGAGESSLVGLGGWPDGERVLGAGAILGEHTGVLDPQGIDGGRELAQALNLMWLQ